ncbi:hypothetical protein AMK59_3576, partial [Oryctes borbonicus]
MYKHCFVIILICAEHLATAGVPMQNFYWRDYLHGEVPFDALEAAPGVYIGQFGFDNGPFVVSIYPHRNSAIAMHFLYTKVTENIKIFCTPEPKNFYWQTVDFAQGGVGQMKNAVRGGYHQPNWILYIGRAMHLKNWKVGKVYDIEELDGPGMYVWGPNNTKVVLQKFDLLKYNATGIAR